MVGTMTCASRIEHWYEVTGRGSGLRLDDLHGIIDADGKPLETVCGVIISAAFLARPRVDGERCRYCVKAAKRRAGDLM
jgi:hypothetical protein